MTDESPVYSAIGREFAGHGTVNHSAEEYVRAAFWHTNTVENFFSIFKRGIYGCYFHVSENTFIATQPSSISAITIGSAWG